LDEAASRKKKAADAPAFWRFEASWTPGIGEIAGSLKMILEGL